MCRVCILRYAKQNIEVDRILWVLPTERHRQEKKKSIVLLRNASLR